MKVVTTIDECRGAVREAQRRGSVVGLVPTMGALHEGHMSLVRAAKARCDQVALSVFVNPTQFGPAEDFNAYPRPLDDDLAKCRAAGVDLVFAPSVEVMYGSKVRTAVHVSGLTDGLCGPHRPGHFDGVATVVAKLFHIAPADAAFFGEKDYQQLMVIRQMAADLNFAIDIVGCPTVREPDDLAMSSRNAYLSPAERKRATAIYRALLRASDAVAAGNKDANVLEGAARRTVTEAGIDAIDYVHIVDARTLARITDIQCPARLCIAVRVGATRLIDNVALGDFST